MLAKFKPLNAALDAAGFGRMPVESSLVSHVGPQDAQCAVGLMNSCWGCGAVEYIPAEFRDSVRPAIEAAIASGDPKVLSAYDDRQLDHPAFSDASISHSVAITYTLPRARHTIGVHL